MADVSSALGPLAPHQSLDDALAGFQAALSDTQRQELQDIRKNHPAADADAVLVFTAGLDSINRQRRGRSTATRLHTFLSSVADFCATMTEGKPCNIADTYISSNPEIAALVWSSVKLAMTIITNFMSYNDGIFNLLMDVTKYCPVVSEYHSLYPESTRLQKSLKSFFAAIVRCCQHLVQVIQRPGYIQFARSITTSIYQEFKQDLNDIENCRKNVKNDVVLAKAQADLRHQQLEAAEREKISKDRKALRRFFSSAENSLEKIANQQMGTFHSESVRRKQQLLDSLSTYDFKRPFKQANEKRFGNTTSWVFEMEKFREWLDAESSILWCTGKIGSGKTMVASSVIQYILNTRGSLGHLVPFFFVQYDDVNSLTSYAILSCLLRQILQRTEISEATNRKIESIIESTSTEELWELLCEIIQTLPKCYMVIDGLEQCERKDRKELVDTLSKLVSSSKTCIFISSRAGLQDELLKKVPALTRLTLDCDATNADIASYISGFIDEKLEDDDWMVGEPSLVDDVKTALATKAQGMFLWASLQLENICEQPSDDDIRDAIDDLPEGLSGTFQRALRRIQSQKHSGEAQKIFPWVAGAKRPLSLDELREAIAVRIGQQYSEPGRLWNSMSNIASWCENLIQVDEESQVVQFAHSTVKDFLLGKPSTNHTAGFHMRLDDVDHKLGEICVTYVNFNDFNRTLALRSKPMAVDPSKATGVLFKPGSKRAALARYLLPKANTTAYDLRSNAAFRSMASEEEVTTLRDSHPFLKYAEVNWILHTAYTQEAKSETWPLWKAIVIDGHDIALMPWDSVSEATILEWAVENRHYALVQLLLTDTTSAFSNGSSISSATTGFKRWLVGNAVARDDGRFLDVLIEFFAGSEALDHGLQIASEVGLITIVEKLLAAKANVNAEALYCRWTALQAAAAHGHIDIVDRLLAAKADVNAKPSYGGQTALQAAEDHGHIDIVKRLRLEGATR